MFSEGKTKMILHMGIEFSLPCIKSNLGSKHFFLLGFLVMYECHKSLENVDKSLKTVYFSLD